MIPAGVPRKPGMTRDDLFNTNGEYIVIVSTAEYIGVEFTSKVK